MTESEQPHYLVPAKNPSQPAPPSTRRSARLPSPQERPCRAPDCIHVSPYRGCQRNNCLETVSRDIIMKNKGTNNVRGVGVGVTRSGYEFKNLSTDEFYQLFSDEKNATKFVEQAVWGDGVYCPRCSSENVYEVKTRKPMSHWCRRCKKYFSVRTNTVMEGTNLKLRKWLRAIHLFHTDRLGTSSIKLSKDLGITQKHAWHLLHRIREAASFDAAYIAEHQFTGEVEVDETLVGGRLGRMHKDKREEAREKPNYGKVIVIGLRERATGKVWTQVIPDTERDTLREVIEKFVAPGATVYTDGHAGYQDLPNHNHEWIYHSGPEKQYVQIKTDDKGRFVYDDNGELVKIHTNSIESFWALLKRGHKGVYLYISPKHTHRYAGEYAYRLEAGNKNNLSTMAETIRRLCGKQLTYKQLTGKENNKRARAQEGGAEAGTAQAPGPDMEILEALYGQGEN